MSSMLLAGALLLAGQSLAAEVTDPQVAEGKAGPEAEARDTVAVEAAAAPERATAGPTTDRDQDAAAEANAPSYDPPHWGVPRVKVAGGLRLGPQTGQGSPPVPLTLAPERVARTASSSPALFWYIDAVPDPGIQLIFYLTDYDRAEPLAEITLAPVQRPGIQRIDLAEHDVELEPDIEYDWAVALVIDPEQRSRDIITNAYVQRVATLPPHPAECRSLQSCSELGLWYDALSAIHDAIEASPEDTALCDQREELLRWAGLGEALGHSRCAFGSEARGAVSGPEAVFITLADRAPN